MSPWGKVVRALHQKWGVLDSNPHPSATTLTFGQPLSLSLSLTLIYLTGLLC